MIIHHKLEEEIEKCILYACAFGNKQNIIKAMHKNFVSNNILDDFCYMRNLFEPLGERNIASYDEEMKLWKLSLGKLFLSCSEEDQIIINTKEFRIRFGNNMSERTIQRKKRELFESLQDILNFVHIFCGNDEQKIPVGKSLNELFNYVWESSKNMSGEHVTNIFPQFWCPNGWMTFVLFVCPDTRLHDSTGYSDAEFQRKKKKKISLDNITRKARTDTRRLENDQINLENKLIEDSSASLTYAAKSSSYNNLVVNTNHMIRSYMLQRDFLVSEKKSLWNEENHGQQSRAMQSNRMHNSSERNNRIEKINREIDDINETLTNKLFPEFNFFRQKQIDYECDSENNVELDNNDM